MWKNIDDYTFNTRDTESWFDVLKSKGKITPWTPKNRPKLEEEKNENFCRFHRKLGHLTVKCRDLREKIQELFVKGEITYIASATNVMTVSHSSLVVKSQKGKENQGKQKKNKEKEIPIVKVKDKEVLLASDKEVKKGLPTHPLLHKLEVQANQSTRLYEGKEIDEEKMQGQPVVQTTSIQEEEKLKLLLQHRKIELRLICNNGRKIVIRGRK